LRAPSTRRPRSTRTLPDIQAHRHAVAGASPQTVASEAHAQGLRRLALFFIGVMVAGSVVGAAVPAGLGWDFANFYDAGRRLLAHQVNDLYHPTRTIAGAPPQGVLGFFGAPLSAVLYVPIAVLPPEAALAAFKLSNIAAFFVTFLLLFRMNRRLETYRPQGDARFLAVFTGLCLLFQPFWTVFRVGGQATPLAVALVTAAVVLQTSGRYRLSSLCWVLAVLLKPVLAPSLVFLMMVSGRSFFVATAIIGAAAAILSVALLGIPVHVDFVRLLIESGRLTYAWYYNSSVFILLDAIRQLLGGAGGPASASWAAAGTLLQVAIVAWIAWLTARARRAGLTEPARQHLQTMLAIMLFLLMARTVWEHYLEFLFLPLIYLVAVRRHLSSAAFGLVCMTFAACAFQNLIFIGWIRGLGTPSAAALIAIVLAKSAPLTLMSVLMLRHWGEWLQSYRDPAWQRVTEP
jgi:hypothetical protein